MCTTSGVNYLVTLYVEPEGDVEALADAEEYDHEDEHEPHQRLARVFHSQRQDLQVWEVAVGCNGIVSAGTDLQKLWEIKRGCKLTSGI